MATPSYEQILQQTQAERIAAYQPVIAATQAQIPTIQAQYAQARTAAEGEKTGLQQRYDQLLGDLGNREQYDIGRENTTTSREFGRRGIPLSSGVFDQTLDERIQPITQNYTSQRTGAFNTMEEGMRNIANLMNKYTTDEQADLANVNAKIAELMAGQSTQAIEAAQARYKTELDNYNEQKRIQIAQSTANSGGGGGGGNSAAQKTFNTQFNNLLKGSNPAAIEAAIYNFLRQGGQGGAAYAKSIGLDDSYYWGIWNKYVDQAKAAGTYGKAPSSSTTSQAKTSTAKQSAADQYFQSRSVK